MLSNIYAFKGPNKACRSVHRVCVWQVWFVPRGVCFIARLHASVTPLRPRGRCSERNREAVHGQAEQATPLIRLIRLISKGEVFLFPEGVPPSAPGFSAAGLMVCHSLVGRANPYLSSIRSAAVVSYTQLFKSVLHMCARKNHQLSSWNQGFNLSRCLFAALNWESSLMLAAASSWSTMEHINVKYLYMYVWNEGENWPPLLLSISFVM